MGGSPRVEEGSKSAKPMFKFDLNARDKERTTEKRLMDGVIAYILFLFW